MSQRNDDDVEIRNLLAQYFLMLDLDDIEGWVRLFTPDGEYQVLGRSFRGHDGLRNMMSAAPGGLHLGGPPVIEIDGDRAQTLQNSLFLDRTTNQVRGSVYDDMIVRTAEGWRIATRRCRSMVSDGLSDRPDI
jgi:hypothetical protein